MSRREVTPTFAEMEHYGFQVLPWNIQAYEQLVLGIEYGTLQSTRAEHSLPPSISPRTATAKQAVTPAKFFILFLLCLRGTSNAEYYLTGRQYQHFTRDITACFPFLQNKLH